MKNKKLLICCIVLASLLAVVILLSALTTLSTCVVAVYNEQGKEIQADASAPSADEILAKYKGKNVVTLSKTDLIGELNVAYPDWYFIDAIKEFPNKIRVCVTRRVPLFVYEYSNHSYYLDSLGNVIQEEEAVDRTLITLDNDVFAGSLQSSLVGAKLTFATKGDNERFDIVLQTVADVWRLYYSLDEVSALIKDFTFSVGTNSVLTMTLTTNAGTKIVFETPTSNLFERLRSAFSIYNNTTEDLQHDGVVITVPVNGKPTTR